METSLKLLEIIEIWREKYGIAEGVSHETPLHRPWNLIPAETCLSTPSKSRVGAADCTPEAKVTRTAAFQMKMTFGPKFANSGKPLFWAQDSSDDEVISYQESDEHVSPPPSNICKEVSIACSYAADDTPEIHHSGINDRGNYYESYASGGYHYENRDGSTYDYADGHAIYISPAGDEYHYGCDDRSEDGCSQGSCDYGDGAGGFEGGYSDDGSGDYSDDGY